VNRRVAVRAGGLLAAAVGVVAGLTAYFSTQTVPPCLVSGVPVWKPPTGAQLHHFELVVPDRAVCLFDMDNDQAPAGYIALPGIRGVTVAEPRGGELALRYGRDRGALVDLTTGRVRYGVAPPAAPPSTVVARDPAAGVEYITVPGRLGFRVQRLGTKDVLASVSFPGFTWNPRFGPNPPDNGLSLAPDRPQLWVLDAPNSVVHVYDVADIPASPPRHLRDIRLTKPIAGDENLCAARRCARIGSLQHSADGRFVYVGDAGDVIDTSSYEEIANLEALHQSRVVLEVDWADGKPEFPGR
jgi:hypothetical protein